MNSFFCEIKKYTFTSHLVLLAILFIISLPITAQAQSNSNSNNIFYHPAQEDQAWVYNGDETYTSTGLNGGSGLRVFKDIYKGDQVFVSFNISEPLEEGSLFARVDGKRAFLAKGETHFSYVFSVSSEKTNDLRVGVDTFPRKDIVLSNIEFILISADSPVENTPPVANSGEDQIVVSNSLVTLDASGSSDKESDLTYLWTQTDNSGIVIDLLDNKSIQPKFNAPILEAGDTLSFELTVTDAEGVSAKDKIKVIVIPENTTELPYENIFYHPAQEDQAWIYNGNESYTSTGLNGNSGLRIFKKIFKGDQVLVTFDINEAYNIGDLFARVDGQKENFTKGSNTFSSLFTVHNNETVDLRIGADIFPKEGVVLSNIQFTLIPLNKNSNPNTSPIADAGQSQIVMTGDEVTLDASGSGDAEGDIYFEWSQIDNTGYNIKLDNKNAEKPIFISPNSTGSQTYSFELKVTDEDGLSSKSLVDIQSIPDLSLRFTPSKDTKIIYVSSSIGDDSLAKAASSADIINPINPNTTIYPFKTLKAAMGELRSGYPDWILLKRGDTWTNENLGTLSKSGRNVNEPILLSYYGNSGDRPIIKTGDKTGLYVHRVTSNIAIVGLDFYAHKRDPHSPDFIDSEISEPGLRFLGGGENILIEDTVVRFFKDNITIESYDGNTFKNFTLRGSIIKNSYSYTSHSQGLYLAGVDGILIEGNFFDHNGWNLDIPKAEATKYNHNIYIQHSNIGKNVVVRNNIIARGSSHGIQGRPAGLYENNLFIENSISLLIGDNEGHPMDNGFDAIARNNVILRGKKMNTTGNWKSTTDAIWGMDIDSKSKNTLIEGNIIANVKDQGLSQMAMKMVNSVTYNQNIIYKWHEPEDMFDDSWPNYTATIENYMASIGAEETLDEFLKQCGSRKINEPKIDYTAKMVNNYFREAFKK